MLTRSPPSTRTTFGRLPATFEEEAPDAQEIALRMDRVQSAGLPWRVMLDGAGCIVAYAYAAPYRTRSAIATRSEIPSMFRIASFSLRPGLRGHAGCHCCLRATGLSADARGDRRQREYCVHRAARAAGFRMVGVHPAVGFKFGRWIDVVHMQLALGEGARSAPA